MKIKPVYIYIGAFVLFILVMLIISGNGDDANSVSPNETMSQNGSSGQMPDDEIHKGMDVPGSEAPSKSNVKGDAIAKMNLLKDEVEKNPNDTTKVREYADMLAIGHKPDEAIKLYESILKKDPKRTDIMLQLTFVYFSKGNVEMAENYNNKVLGVDNTNQYASYNKGVIAAAKGNNAKAKEIWADVSKKFKGTEIGNMAQHSIMLLEAQK